MSGMKYNCWKMTHRRGCTGNCLYCQHLKRIEESKENVKLRKMTLIAWDEVSVMI
jgi:wyosine [tRNA(Phe)-imidazoG37] synthetase (radical SAM superfamily)